MSFSIIKPGLLDTIQDMGRHGYGNWGISAGGAMDRYAAKVANMLVGNCCTDAVLEMHFPGPQILFEQNALITITGADFCPMLNDEPAPLWQPIVVRRNTLLHFTQLKWGSRCYLGLHGGFYIDKWLNSYGTHLKAGMGGWHGRALKKGDDLSPRESRIYFAGLLKENRNIRVLPWRADTGRVYDLPHEIFVTTGNEWNDLSPASQAGFLENNFIIHPSSDRMGYQLKGIGLEFVRNTELVSSAISQGTIQWLPAGHLVVLMADYQTAGAFPRIAHAVSAHLPKLAQLRPSDCLQFKITDHQTAERLLLAQQKELQILERACKERLNQLVS